MLLFNTVVFDEVINTTTTTWYSYAQFNSTLGAADSLCMMALLTNRGTTTPTASIFGDDSVDGRNWVLGSSALVTGTLSTDSKLIYAFKTSPPSSNLSPGAFARFRLTLSGTNAQCRVQITATGRSL